MYINSRQYERREDHQLRAMVSINSWIENIDQTHFSKNDSFVCLTSLNSAEREFEQANTVHWPVADTIIESITGMAKINNKEDPL